jgi:hypothetical protein
MGVFNVLKVFGKRCPKCNKEGDWRIEFKFGVVDLLEYHIDDKLIWKGYRTSIPKEAPIDREWCGEGFGECLLCLGGFWTTVIIRDNIIREVLLDIPRTLGDESTK